MEKQPVVKGESKQGIGAYLKEALESSGSSGLELAKEEYRVEQIIQANELKEQRLKDWGLPMEKRYGIFKSLAEMKAEVVGRLDQNKLENNRFLVRCAPVDINNRDTKLQRKFNCTWGEAQQFVQSLPGGSEKYTIELRDYEPAEVAGTIIADGDGSIIIDLIKGNHADIEKASLGKESEIEGISGNKKIGALYNAQFRAKEGVPHFVWEGGSDEGVKEVGIRALEHFAPGLDREELEHLKIYAEFVWGPQQGFKFLEVSADDFWTKL